MPTARHWTKRPAPYPTPMPLAEIWVESFSSFEVKSSWVLIRLVLAEVTKPFEGPSSDRRADVEFSRFESESGGETSNGRDSRSESPRSGVSVPRAAMTSGWLRTSNGRKELRSTKEAPKDVLEMIVNRAPRRYVSLEMKMYDMTDADDKNCL